MKCAWKETCEETLGRKSKQHKAYVSIDTLKKIEVRKERKAVVNNSRTRAAKAEVQTRYSNANKEVKRSIRRDKIQFTEELACQAEDTVGQGNMNCEP